MYDFFGIKKTATQEEIKQAYKKLALLYHPDKSINKDADKFKKLAEYYSILSDPQKRKDYDCFGDNMPIYNPNTEYWELSLPITLEELYSKKEKELLFNYYIDCQKCINIHWNETITCSECNNGKIYLFKKCNIKPQLNPIEIKLTNRNFVLLFKLEKHKYFTKIHNDLEINLDMPLYENLTYSYCFTCPFLDGSNITIQPDVIIKPNEKYIIKGFGMSSENNLHVNFNIIFPNETSEKKCIYLRKIFKLKRPISVNDKVKLTKYNEDKHDDRYDDKFGTYFGPQDIPSNCVQQ